MKEKSRIWKALGKIAYILSCILFVILLVIADAVIVNTCKLETVTRGIKNIH